MGKQGSRRGVAAIAVAAVACAAIALAVWRPWAGPQEQLPADSGAATAGQTPGGPSGAAQSDSGGGGAAQDYSWLLEGEDEDEVTHLDQYLWPENDAEALYFRLHPDYYVDETGEEIAKGMLNVYFKPGLEERRMRQVVGECGGEWYGGNYYPELGGLIYVRVPDGEEREKRAELEAYPEVDGVSLNVKYEGGAFFSSGDLGDDASVRGIVVADEGQKYHLAASRFYEAWETARCEGAVTVAVLDSGKPKKALSDIELNVDYERAYDASTGTGKTGVDPIGHGTAVAGVVSAIAGNGAGTDGASYNAKVLPVKVSYGDERSPRLEYVADGLNYLCTLDPAPDVVNMSFGFPLSFAYSEDNIKDADEIADCIARLRGRGTVVVAAAGNTFSEFSLNKVDPSLDVANFPATLPGVLSVGAAAAPTSEQMGAILAEGGFPGARMGDFSVTKSNNDIAACGGNITVLSPLPEDFPGFTLAVNNGTSLAAPQVAAAAALVKKAHPEWGAGTVERALTETAAPVAGEGAGSGLLDAAAALGWRPPGGYVPPGTGGSFWEAARGMDERRGE